jgi:hypothetical protein
MKYKYKIGDKVKIKYFSEYMWKKILKKYGNEVDYEEYLDSVEEYFNMQGVIQDTRNSAYKYKIYFDGIDEDDIFYEEELEFYYILPDKIKTLKELLNASI